jgi:hypothetical protein
MRPSPQDVHGWFASGITEDHLTDHLATLDADPNWQVVVLPGSAERTLQLCYYPTGEQQEIVLQRVGRLWKRL